ncbi:hypothetical protein [Pseudoroseomonas cervicalis]|uniref:hypothetical protein n=1 Tax=Teichococcus cervicalis TaxID=204525 RepID=UPI0022F150E7|nr:hypothetical protein [Pseudoroseomonas cervicalis]WBV45552.1 hypothetical protein PFY06_21305 [Pseudoroseomonas cervicalis]
MTSTRWRRHTLLQTAAMLGAVALGARAGAMEGLAPRLDWGLAGGLGLAWAAGAWMWWRSRQPGPSAGLRLSLARPAPQDAPAAQTMEGVLHFATTAPLAWCARRGEWCLDLVRSGREDLPWRMALRRADLPQEAVPLAEAATLDAVLQLSRRLFAQGGLWGGGLSGAMAGPGAAPGQAGAARELREAAELLECDLEFSLPAGRSQMTALAEGGYALRDSTGLHPISAQLADRLLAQAPRRLG